MKKMLSVLLMLLIASPAMAARRELKSLLGPATSTSNVTITAPASGSRNCLTDIDVVSASTYTFRMLDGGTTFYALGPLAANAPLVKNYDIDVAPCGSDATAVTLSVDNGTFKINYNGYVR